MLIVVQIFKKYKLELILIGHLLVCLVIACLVSNAFGRFILILVYSFLFLLISCIQFILTKLYQTQGSKIVKMLVAIGITIASFMWIFFINLPKYWAPQHKMFILAAILAVSTIILFVYGVIKKKQSLKPAIFFVISFIISATIFYCNNNIFIGFKKLEFIIYASDFDKAAMTKDYDSLKKLGVYCIDNLSAKNPPETLFFVTDVDHSTSGFLSFSTNKGWLYSRNGKACNSAIKGSQNDMNVQIPKECNQISDNWFYISSSDPIFEARKCVRSK